MRIAGLTFVVLSASRDDFDARARDDYCRARLTMGSGSRERIDDGVLTTFREMKERAN